MSVNTIGDKLRRSAGAAKLLMFRARQAIKECLLRKQRVDEG
jgi:DNA-directed RNA polymerase specialized sigma24 family protein